MADSSLVDNHSKLTVILTLKGREEFTPRWISYHSDVGLPWLVLVGDGAPSDSTEAQLSSVSKFHVSYRRYQDSDLLAFYRKLRDLVAASDTPYVMLCDNDDFIMPQGVSRCIRFLDANEDYVSCSGEVLGMYVTDQSFSDSDRIFGGTVHRLKSIYESQNHCDDSAERRVTDLLGNYAATWYAVHRRDALLAVFSDLVDRKIADIALMELLVATELVALGKYKIDKSCVSYLRQLNSSQGAASSGGFFAHELSSSVERDLDSMVKSLAAMIDGGSTNSATNARMKSAIMNYRKSRMESRPPLAVRMSRFIGRYLHTLRAKIPAVRGAFDIYEKRKLIADLRKFGADAETVDYLRDELHLVWKAIGHRSRSVPAEAVVCAGRK